MKQIYMVNNVISREWTGIAPTMPRVWSRIGTIKPLLALFALLIIGAWSSEVWGKTESRTWQASTKVTATGGQATVRVMVYNVLTDDTQKDSKSTSDATLVTAKATWSKNYTIIRPTPTETYYPEYSASAFTGYSFGGWYNTSNGLVSQDNPFYPREGNGVLSHGATNDSWDYTYYAKFTPNPYTVKFNGNGNTGGSMNNQGFTYDVAQNLTANGFTKTGYTFSGWNTESDGKGDPYTNEQSVSNLTSTNNGTVTLYAQWTANTYKVEFNGNGSTSGSMNVQTLTYDATAQLSAFTGFKREYTVSYNGNGGSTPTSTVATYTFDHWNTVANNGGTTYADKASVKNLAASGTFNLYAQWNSGSVVLPNATKMGGVIEGWYNGSTKVGVPGDSFTPSANITLTAHWIDQYPFTMSGDDYELFVGDTKENAYTFTYAENPEVHISPSEIISYANGTITALSEGMATIYFTQANTSSIQAGESDHWTVKVSRVANTLALATDAETKYVGEEVTGILDLTTKNSDATIETSSTDATIAYYDVAQNKIVIPNSEAKSFNSTEVTIKIWQALNVQYTASGEKTFTLTVNKRTPEFSVSKTSLELEQTSTLKMDYVDGASVTIEPAGVITYNNGTITGVGVGSAKLTVTQPETKAINYKKQEFTIFVVKKTPSLTVKMNGTAQTSMSVTQGNTVSVTFDKNSDASVVVTNLSGSQYASYVNGTMTAGAVGTAIYRASLEETATFKSGYVDFSLTVNPDSRHVPITMSGTLWNNNYFRVSSDGSNSWDGSKGITLGDATWGGFNWDDKYVVLHFEGVPDKLTFDIATSSSNATQVEWYVQESATNNFNSAIKKTYTHNSTSFASQSIQLDPNSRYVKLCYSGNFAGYFRNVHISELKYVQDPEPTSVDFGSAVINSGKVEKEVNINWCNIAPLTVTSSNPRFTVSPSSFGDLETLGSQTLTISYTHTADVGTNTGTITISNGDDKYTKTIPVTATTTKRPQTITWNSLLVSTGFAMNLNEQYPDATITTIATATSGKAVTFTSANSDIIEVVDGYLRAKADGKVEITAYQAGDGEYQEKYDTTEFTVTSKQKQSINWNQNLYGLLTTSASFGLTATASSGGDITYTSADETVVRIEGSTLIVVGEGETYITALQAGGDVNHDGIEWLPISQNNYVIVRDPNSPCTGMALSEGALTLNSGNGFSKTYNLAGTPKTLTFSAKHGEKSVGIWIITQPTYAALMVDEWAKVDGVWKWQNKYNTIVGTSDTPSGTIQLDPTATKIRFSTTETETEHFISNIRVAREKFMSADVDAIDTEVECNTNWNRTITISHSNIDFMTVTTKRGLLTLSTSSLGEGCEDLNNSTFTVSRLVKKNEEFMDTIVITDGKTVPTTVEIPVRLYAVGWNQTISGFDVPATAWTTDRIGPFTATATSGLAVTYEVSNPSVARIVDGNYVEFISSGTVNVIAKQTGDDHYNAVEESKTIVVSKVEPAITYYPEGTSVPYLGTLGNSTLSGGQATVTLRGVATVIEGTFAWKKTSQQITDNAGPHSYAVVFTPKDGKMYTTKELTVAITITRANAILTISNGSVQVSVGSDVSQINLDNLITSQTPGTVSYEVTSDNKTNSTLSGSLFSATATGEYTILATKAQTEYYSEKTAAFKVLVTPRANTLSVQGTYDKHVDDEIDNVVTTNSNGTIHTSSDNENLAYYDVKQNKIFIPNSDAQMFGNSTQVTIKIWQDANDQFDASAEKEIKLTVRKYSNSLNCRINNVDAWTKALNFDEGAKVTFTSDNHVDPIEVTQKTGKTVGNIIATYYAEKDSIYAFWNIGQATWEVKQEENYKYVAATPQTVTVNVDKIEYSCDVLNNSNEYELNTIETGPAFTLLAAGDQLYFEGYRTNAAINQFFVQYSTDEEGDTNFEDIQEVVLAEAPVTGSLLDDPYESYGPIAIPEGTKRIRFRTITGATLVKHYRNIRVTRKNSFRFMNAAENGTELSSIDLENKVICEEGDDPNSVEKTVFVEYNTCPGQIKVASNHPHITINESEFNTTENNGKGVIEITIKYTCPSFENITGTITVYTPYDHKTLIVNAQTKKQAQTLTWKPDFANESVLLSVGYTTKVAATASSELPVKYSVEDGEESMIQIDEDGYQFTVVGVGTVHLTATQEGNACMEAVSGTRTIYATDKKLQKIKWNQDLIHTLAPKDTVRLLAEVYVLDNKTGNYVKDNARTALLTYSCTDGNNDVIKVSNDSLIVLNYGSTTITASVPYDENYEVTPDVTLPVTVRVPSAGCDDPLLVNHTEQIQLFIWNIDWGFSGGLSIKTPEIIGDTLWIDQSQGQPNKLLFQHEGEEYKIPIIGTKLYSGKIKVEQYVEGNGWSEVPGSYLEPTRYLWQETDSLQLNSAAKAIRFKRDAGATGYHNISNVKVTLLPYLKADTTVIDLGPVPAGAVLDSTIAISYADVKGTLMATVGTPQEDIFTVTKAVNLSCGSVGKYKWPIHFAPLEVTDSWQNTVTIQDELSKREVVVTIKAKVTPGALFIYKDIDGNEGVWGNTDNWSKDDLPGKDDYVKIASDVTIPQDADVTVRTLAINEGVTVNVEGKLTVLESTPGQEKYGNLHIAKTGFVDVHGISAGWLKVNDFILDAALGSYRESGSIASASSGQIEGAKDRLEINGDAYFQLTLDPSGTMTYGWYDFVLPFEVDVIGGISVVENTSNIPLEFNKNYAVMDYSQEKRAENGKYWNKFRGTMLPGRAYTITLDDDNPTWNTVLFKKNAGASIIDSRSYKTSYSTSGAPEDCGWNGFGNGSLQHAELDVDEEQKILIYDHAKMTFHEHEAKDYTIAIGTSFFMQFGSVQTVELLAATGNDKFLAPARDGRSTEEFRLALTAEGADNAADRLWVSASEEATGEYVIGHDLLKMGNPTEAKLARMWTVSNNNRLCDIELPLANNAAHCDLYLFAPQARTYSLAVEKAPQDVVLYLTYNDRPIWNLTMSPYEFDLEQGTTEGYGLQLYVRQSPEVATGVDGVQDAEIGARKVLINDKIYLITPEGAIFSVTGKKIQ